MLDMIAVRFVSMACAALALCTGCLTPPCNCAQANAPAAADTGGGAAPAGDTTVEASPAPAGSQVVWDGDETGGAAKGWADCDKKPACKALLGPEPGVGRNNSIGLKFAGEGPGWIGSGWNLFGWWPKDAGVDVSGTTHLVLWVKVEIKNAEQGFAPDALTVALKCSNSDKCISNPAPLAKYTKDKLLDGQWHEIAVPLSDVKKVEFDPKKVWEVGVNVWSETPKSFTVFVDDISFQKR